MPSQPPELKGYYDTSALTTMFRKLSHQEFERSNRPVLTIFYLSRLYLEATSINETHPIQKDLLTHLVRALLPLVDTFNSLRSVEIGKLSVKEKADKDKLSVKEKANNYMNTAFKHVFQKAMAIDVMTTEGALSEPVLQELKMPEKPNTLWEPDDKHLTLRWMLMTVLLLARRNLLLTEPTKDLKHGSVSHELGDACYDAWVMCRLWRFREDGTKWVLTHLEAQTPKRQTPNLPNLQPEEKRKLLKNSASMQIAFDMAGNTTSEESCVYEYKKNLRVPVGAPTKNLITSYLDAINRMSADDAKKLKFVKARAYPFQENIDVWVQNVDEDYDKTWPIRTPTFKVAYPSFEITDRWCKMSTQYQGDDLKIEAREQEKQKKKVETSPANDSILEIQTKARRIPWSKVMELRPNMDILHSGEGTKRNTTDTSDEFSIKNVKQKVDPSMDYNPVWISFDLHPALAPGQVPIKRVDPLSPLSIVFERDRVIEHAALAYFLSLYMARINNTPVGNDAESSFTQYKSIFEKHHGKIMALPNLKRTGDVDMDHMDWATFGM